MLKTFNPSWFTKSHFICSFLLFFDIWWYLKRLSMLNFWTQQVFKTYWKTDFWYLIIISNLHFVSIDWYTIIIRNILTLLMALVMMINIDAINIFLIWDRSSVKVDSTEWSFFLFYQFVYFIPKFINAYPLFCSFWLPFCLIIDWVSNFIKNFLSTSWFIDIFLWIMVEFFMELSSNLFNLRYQLLDFIFLLGMVQYSAFILFLDSFLIYGWQILIFKFYSHFFMDFKIVDV